MSFGMSIKHPFSVLDGTKISIKQAFSWILNYYDPNKKKDEKYKKSKVLDSTCSKMLMWDKEDLYKFQVVTNDIRPEIKADYHHDCSELSKYIKQKFDIIIYDPPYIDIKTRKDKDKYEDAFNYEAMKNMEDLSSLTVSSSFCFNTLLKSSGILIAKITNFHYDGVLRGSYDLVRWFRNCFYLWDEIIYRFYKNVPNMNFYNRRSIKTHTYFLIFKKLKQDIKNSKVKN